MPLVWPPGLVGNRLEAAGLDQEREDALIVAVGSKLLEPRPALVVERAAGVAIDDEIAVGDRFQHAPDHVRLPGPQAIAARSAANRLDVSPPKARIERPLIEEPDARERPQRRRLSPEPCQRTAVAAAGKRNQMGGENRIESPRQARLWCRGRITSVASPNRSSPRMR